jgi:hypothetical protein
MADIKQAAKWIQEDRTVERESAAGKWWASAWHPGLLMWCITCADGGEQWTNGRQIGSGKQGANDGTTVDGRAVQGGV